MPTKTLAPRAYSFLLSEAPGTLSREEVTILTGEVLDAGTVLGKVTISSKHVAYSGAAADGSEDADCILCDAVDATDGDQKATVIARLAEVDENKLVGADADGLADLAVKLIIARS